MTATSDLYASTLTTLYNTKSTLLSEAWHDSLDANATKQQKIDASVAIMDTTNAIVTLSNAQLSDIASQMAAQADALNTAISGMKDALKNIQTVKTVLDGITKLIGVVAKIVPLL